MIRLLATAVVAATLTGSLYGQRLERDRSSGDYLLTYTDNNGVQHVDTIQAADQVHAELVLKVERAATGFVYGYTLRNGAGAKRSIGFLDLLCPGGNVSVTIAGPSSWNARISTNGRLDGLTGVRLCEYSYRTEGAWLAPGTTRDSLTIASSWLPAVRSARAHAIHRVASLPTLVEDTPDTVYRLVDRAQGFQFLGGGGAVLASVVPARPPEAFANPRLGLDSIAADVSQSCKEVWIRVPEVCPAFAAMLARARQAIADGRPRDARSILGGFLRELDARHGAGGEVNDNAYWLLKTNVEFLARTL